LERKKKRGFRKKRRKERDVTGSDHSSPMKTARGNQAREFLAKGMKSIEKGGGPEEEWGKA